MGLHEQLVEAGVMPDEAKAAAVAAMVARPLSESAWPDLHELPLSELRESKLNMRKTFVRLDELAQSIKANGLLVRLLVRPVDGKYEIVCGHRRFRAVKLAGLDFVPVDVRALTDEQAVESQIAENLQRSNPTALEEAEAYDALREAGYTVEQIAEKTGQALRTVHSRLQLLALSPKARAAVLDGSLPDSAATPLAAVLRHAEQDKILAVLSRQYPGDGKKATPKIPARAAIEFITREATRSLKHAPFSLKDDSLVAEAGSCAKCPKNVRNMPGGLFESYDSKDLCTDVPCWKQKARAEWERVQQKAIDDGFEVLTTKRGAELFPNSERLEWNSEFVELNEPNTADTKRRTWNQLLEKVEAKPTIYVCPDRDLRPHLIVKRAEATAALAEVGAEWAKAEVKQQSTRKKETAREKESKSEQKIRRAVLGDLAARLGERVAEKGATPEDWRMLADHFAGDGGVSDDLLAPLNAKEADLRTALSRRDLTKQDLRLLVGFAFACVIRFGPIGQCFDGYSEAALDLAKRVGAKLADLEKARERAKNQAGACAT